MLTRSHLDLVSFNNWLYRHVHTPSPLSLRLVNVIGPAHTAALIRIDVLNRGPVWMVAVKSHVNARCAWHNTEWHATERMKKNSIEFHNIPSSSSYVHTFLHAFKWYLPKCHSTQHWHNAHRSTSEQLCDSYCTGNGRGKKAEKTPKVEMDFVPIVVRDKFVIILNRHLSAKETECPKICTKQIQWFHNLACAGCAAQVKIRRWDVCRL